MVEDAIKDAKENVIANKVTNCEFFAGKAEDRLSPVIRRATKPDIIAVVDPPRAGLRKISLRNNIAMDAYRHRANCCRSKGTVDYAQSEKIIQAGLHILRPSSSREELGGLGQAHLEAIRWRAFCTGESCRRGHVSAYEALRISIVFGEIIRSHGSTRYPLGIAVADSSSVFLRQMPLDRRHE